jgi:hypothetical protein
MANLKESEAGYLTYYDFFIYVKKDKPPLIPSYFLLYACPLRHYKDTTKNNTKCNKNKK